MSKGIDLWEVDSATRYMVEELSKEMETVVKLAFKPIHETLDRIERSRKRQTQNLHHPTRRSLNEDDESVDRHSFVSNRRPSQATQSFCARMDQCIKNVLLKSQSENIITTIPAIQSPNKEEMVIGLSSSFDTDDDGGAEPEMLLEKELDDAETDQEILSEEEPVAEEIEAPSEHVLVSNQDLSVQIHVGEDEQRENTFHMKFDAEDKVCSMILDGGSCTNVVSVTMKEKLVLPILKHPKSYRLQWLNDSGVVKAMKQVRVPIHISKYEDDVELQEESGPKKKMKKKLKGKDIMQWSFLARIEGFVFDPGIHDSDLRTNPSQEEGNDAAQGPNFYVHIQVSIGPITRARMSFMD